MHYEVGKDIYNLCTKLYPINRSITGDGVRQTLGIIKEIIPELNIYEVKTGTKCFDWDIPKEWNIKEAYIIDPEGNKICDIKENNLHIVGYSISIDEVINLDELNSHLHSLADLPNAIPYITSYYNETWGFCITENERKKLKEGNYKVYIDSSLTAGSLTYGELLIKGNIEKEIFLSTYICHPSMANNELSGPTLVTYLSKYIQNLKNRKYSYRIIFIPETIGSIMYLSKNIDIMKKNIIAGFNVSCVGDNNSYSFLPSNQGDTLSDRISRHVMNHAIEHYAEYSFIDDRGSDERQYCYPGIDLPVCSIMRTKYNEYKEYHTSLDNLDYISPEGLSGAYNVYTKVIMGLENNFIYKSNILCEPQLGKRGLYPMYSTKDTWKIVKNMINLLVKCSGKLDLIGIAEDINVPIWELYEIVEKFQEQSLIEKIDIK